jgi:hypothetical protein
VARHTGPVADDRNPIADDWNGVADDKIRLRVTGILLRMTGTLSRATETSHAQRRAYRTRHQPVSVRTKEKRRRDLRDAVSRFRIATLRNERHGA